VRKLWPRSLVQPPLSEADQRVYTEAVKAEARRPEQRVDVDFDPAATEGHKDSGAA
jgi:membrane protein